MHKYLSGSTLKSITKYLSPLPICGVIIVIALGVIIGYKATTKDSTGETSLSTLSVIKRPIRLASNTVANTTLEEVPDLGIQLQVPNTISDLTYQTTAVTLRDGVQAQLAYFSTASLASQDSNCSPANGIGSLEKVSGQYPNSDENTTLDYGQLVKQFPSYYIAAGWPQSSCSTLGSVQASIGSDQQSLREAEGSAVQSD